MIREIIIGRGPCYTSVHKLTLNVVKYKYLTLISCNIRSSSFDCALLHSIRSISLPLIISYLTKHRFQPLDLLAGLLALTYIRTNLLKDCNNSPDTFPSHGDHEHDGHTYVPAPPSSQPHHSTSQPSADRLSL